MAVRAAIYAETFFQGVKKHAGIKAAVEKKVRAILEHPVELGEPLKGVHQGFYSCPVKKSFLIVFLYCNSCRKKGDDAFVRCRECKDREDETVIFVMLAPHDEAYRKIKRRE